MIGDYLPHSFVFARSLCVEDFDIPSKSCSGSVPLAVRCDCLQDTQHCNWVVSTLEVLLLSHRPAPHKRHFPDSWNGVLSFCRNETPPNLSIILGSLDFCFLFLCLEFLLPKIWSRQDVTQQRWESWDTRANWHSFVYDGCWGLLTSTTPQKTQCLL